MYGGDKLRFENPSSIHDCCGINYLSLKSVHSLFSGTVLN